MMNANKIKCMAVLVTVAAALVGVRGFAQQQAETSEGVARVSLIRGDVSMQRGDSGEWVAVTVNTPLVPGDTIVTGAGSRAEVQLDYSDVLRLDQNSQAKIADLTRSRIQLQVASGTVDLAVFQGYQAASEVDTPNVAVEPLQAGTYRIAVNSNDLSLVTVRAGQAQVSTPQGSTNVDAGNQITVEGSQNPQYKITSAQPLDAWDNWNHERNGIIERASNYDHVNRYYTGAQDLNAYGRWVYVPNHDWCWTPYVNAGWVPYSYGRWVWEPFWGWTWVSYDPWGWAPFHYGRWFFYGSSWFWWPGAVTAGFYPLWAPAYVSFIGFGYGYHHFGFGFGWGFNSIGWCPLGPRDRFDPWWGRGRSFNVVNINNYYGGGRGLGRGGRGFRNSNLEAAMGNFHVRRAITTMPADRFGREAVYRNRQPVSVGMLRGADVVRGTLPVVPTRASLTASNRAPVVPRAANRNVGNVHFFSRRSAGSGNLNRSFHSQAASVRQMMQTSRRGVVGARPGNAQAQANRTFRASGANENRGNVRAFANGRQQNSGRVVNAFGGRAQTQARPAQSAAPGNRQGWSRFGTEVARGGQQRSQAANPQNSRNASTRAGWSRFQNRAPASSTQPARGNSQRFSPRQGPSVRPQQNRAPASSTQPARGNSQRFSPRQGSSARPQQNRSSGFRSFTPQAAPRNEGRSSNFSRAGPQSNNGNRGNWSRFTPRAEAPAQSRGGGNYSPRYERRPSYGGRAYSRPPLQLNKPIVTERRSYSAPRGNSAYRRGGGDRGSSPHYSRGSGGGSFHGGGGRRGGGGGGSRRGGGGGRGRR